MDDNIKSFLGFLTAVVLAILIIAISVCYHSKIMLENGYEQVIEKGYAGYLWQKAKE